MMDEDKGLALMAVAWFLLAAGLVAVLVGLTAVAVAVIGVAAAIEAGLTSWLWWTR